MMRTLKFLLVVLITTALAVEVICRTYLCLHFKAGFFNPSDVVYAYYPELRTVIGDLNRGDTSKTTLLILGGSVVNDELCDLSSKLEREWNAQHAKKLKVFSLARNAHNSLDSRYKMQLLQNYRFDYVFMYHGINDTRANNCPADVFDKHYRHIQFYDELYVYFRHPEINITAAPYVLDLLHELWCIKTKRRPTIPREYYVLNERIFEDVLQQDSTENPARYKELKERIRQNRDHIIRSDNFEEGQDAWLNEGANVKSISTFAANQQFIATQCRAKGEKLILFTFAWYLPDNYNLHDFFMRKLDYNESRWPAELYGKPVNVVKGIAAHNIIIEKTAGTDRSILFEDFCNLIPKNKLYFDDVCHLSPDGCGFLEKHILAKLEQQK